MNTHEIANRLVELCRKGDFVEAEIELYDANIIHIEIDNQEFKGFNDVLLKEEQFLAKLKTKPLIEVSDPIVAGKYFTIRMFMQCEHEERGAFTIEEIIIYKVNNGKIVYLRCYA